MLSLEFFIAETFFRPASRLEIGLNPSLRHDLKACAHKVADFRTAAASLLSIGYEQICYVITVESAMGKLGKNQCDLV